MHSYFGQVGNKALPDSSTDNAPATTATATAALPLCTASDHSRTSHRPPRTGSMASLGSLVEVRRYRTVDTPPASDDLNFGTAYEAEKQDTFTQPPTPISADPYEVEANGKTAENGGSLADGGLASITSALRNIVLPKSSFASRASRHQSLPTSSVTRSSVAAAHFSNPTSSSHSPQRVTPTTTPPSSELIDASISVQELNKLTSDVASGSREKNTPPLTPRALSQTEKAPRSPRSNTSAPTSDDGANSQSTTSARPADTLPTGPPRGKLTVRIAEGRGLRPAVEPYCVCVFDWNEYISEGPRQDRMEIDTEERKPSTTAAMAMRRTDSDMGRSMAIPPRSRQSNTNGHDGKQGMDKITHPQWDHEATL